MTRDGLKRARNLLGEIDDAIYLDARGRAVEEHADLVYTEDETRLTEIIDEAQGQVTKMMETAV